MYNNTMKKEINHIAIVRLSALGDIVNASVVLQYIKQFYPNIKIDWITEEVFAPLLDKHPLINDVITLNLKKFKKDKSLTLLQEQIQKLKETPEYDLVIDMQGLIKSSLVAKFAGEKRHGFDKHSTRESLAAFFYTSTSHIAYEENVIKRNCFVVSDPLEFEISSDMLLTKQRVFPFTKTFTLSKEKKNIALVIGASWESKIYPIELLADVCNGLKEQFYIIWGSEAEKKMAHKLSSLTPFTQLAPKMTLDELVSYISSMDLVIGNDTGPTHMAWAQNIPSITLFGPTNTRMIYETTQNIGIKSPSKVDILKINKNDFSIKEIPPQIVIEKAKELLR